MARVTLQAVFLTLLLPCTYSSEILSDYKDVSPGSVAKEPSLSNSLVTEEIFQRQKRDFPLETKGGAKREGYFNIKSEGNALYGMIFGHLLLKDEKKRTTDHYQCEGVLIGPKHVLSVHPDCDPAQAKKPAGVGDEIVFQYTLLDKGMAWKATVKVESFWNIPNCQYIIGLLEDDDHIKKIKPSDFPVLSWTKQEGPENYNLFLETADNYPVLLSTPTATQDLSNGQFNGILRRVLKKSKYSVFKASEIIKLKRGGIREFSGGLAVNVKVGGPAKPLSGAAFFKKTSKTIALVALVSDYQISKCEENALEESMAGKSQEGAKGSSRSVADTLLCGFRLDWGHVRTLYQIGLAVDDGLPRDNKKVIPGSTVLGSWNMNSLTRMSTQRALSTKVYEAFVKVIQETQILALQEVKNFKDSYDTPAQSSLSLLNGIAHIAYKAADEYAFVFDTNKVGLATNQKQECGLLSLAASKNYAYWCKFKFVRKDECFTMYSAHFQFTGGSSRNRAKEFSAFGEHAKAVQQSGAANCSRIQIIAGDFNFQSTNEVTDTAESLFLDAGPTTPAKKTSHYDHILVSETLRMAHYYVYPGFTSNTGPKESSDLQEPYANKFYPIAIGDSYNPPLRAHEPKVRSYQLSDHLPVQVKWNGLNIGTWNMENHRAGHYNDEYTRVFLLFSVLAVQELKVDVPNKLYGRKWMLTSGKLNGEYLAFAYDDSTVTLRGCSEIDLSSLKAQERPGFGCVFSYGSNPSAQVLAVVSLHLVNAPPLSKAYVKKVLNYIRTLSTDVDSSANPGTTFTQSWGKAYIMGDFNVDISSEWKESFVNRKCIHTKYLHSDPSGPWTFTKLQTRKTLDYIFTPEPTAVTNHIPGGVDCKVINPELHAEGGTEIIGDVYPSTPFRFFGYWNELSDHYPVFMKFAAPFEVQGNTASRTKALKVLQLWPSVI